jgi:hypothetical protein
MSEAGKASETVSPHRGYGHDRGQVSPRKLYAWLGEQIKVSRQDSADNELAVNLDASVGPMYHAEAFAHVRQQMRRFDSSLPFENDLDEI